MFFPVEHSFLTSILDPIIFYKYILVAAGRNLGVKGMGDRK